MLISTYEYVKTKVTKGKLMHACISALSVTNTLAVLILAFFMARQQLQQEQVKQDTLWTLPSTAGVDTQ